jgi:hypothetical protein
MMLAMVCFTGTRRALNYESIRLLQAVNDLNLIVIERRRRVSVVAAQGEGRARWLGGGRPASFAVCRAAEAVIAGTAPGSELSKLEELQEQLPFVDGTRIPIVHNGQDNIRIWTFAGGLTNAAPAQVIPGPIARSDDFCITIRAGTDTAAIDSFSRLDAVSIRPSFSSGVTSPAPHGS